MIRRALIGLAIAASLAFGAAGCASKTASPHAGGEETKVRDTVVLYDQLLAQGFERENMSPLGQVATTDQAYKEYYQMAAIGEMKRRLLPALVSFEMGPVSLEGTGTASVSTTETWDYVQVSTAKESSGTVAARETGVVYRLTYTLVKKGERWFVSSIRDAGGRAR